MAFERLRAHGAAVGAVAVLLLGGLSAASLVVAEGRLAELDQDAAARAERTTTTTPTTTTAAATTATVTSGPSVGFAAELFTLINSDRATRGLAPLVWDGHLHATAQHVSDVMAESELIAQQDLAPVHALGYGRAAENVLTASSSVTAAAVENAWMGSTPHRAAILDDAYTAVGIAATSSADGRVWITVHFGGSI
jgi:uncharacterized protein YkwD